MLVDRSLSPSLLNGSAGDNVPCLARTPLETWDRNGSPVGYFIALVHCTKSIKTKKHHYFWMMAFGKSCRQVADGLHSKD